MGNERITDISLEDGGLNVQIEGGACRILAEAFAEQFLENGGKNYVELSFQHEEIGTLTVTMQKASGMTPGAKVAKLKELIKGGKIDEALAL